MPDFIERRLFDEAIRLGDYQSDRVIDLAHDVRRLRRAMHRAVALIRSKPDKALTVLEEELKR